MELAGQSDLRHYSSRPLGIIEPREQEASYSSYGWYIKPRGLWVSVKGTNDWPSWCKAEGFGNPDNQLEYRIRLANNSNVLHLETALDLDEFTIRFGTKDRGNRYMIQWPFVAKSYQGIIISPYCHERRLEENTAWYYGWDCASGCIWDPMAISSVAHIGGPKYRDRVDGEPGTWGYNSFSA